MRHLHIWMIIALAFVLCRAGAADRFAFPQLLVSPYVDTEISTNIPFSSGEELSRRMSLTMELDALSNNTVQVAFGTDIDADGELSWSETEFLLGWRCGGWFCRDKKADAECFVQREIGHKRLDWTLFLNVERSPNHLSANDDVGELGFSVSRGMFNPSWNLARIAMRGSWGVSYEIHGGLFISPLTIRIR